MFPADRSRSRLAAIVAASLLVGLLPLGAQAVTRPVTDLGVVTLEVNGSPLAVDDPGVGCQPADSFGGSLPIPEDYAVAGTDGEWWFLLDPCSLLANDTDPDGDTLAWEIVGGPSHGTLHPSTTVTGYKPDANFSTPSGDWPSDSFTYRAFDGAEYSEPATMRFWIAPVNDPPTFDAGSAEVTVAEDSGAYGSGWATNPSAGPDESSQMIHFEVETDFNGVPDLFAVAPAVDGTGNLTFTPAADRTGLVHVTVRAVDDGGLENYGRDEMLIQPDDTSADATFDIVVTSDAVTAVDDDATVPEDPDPAPWLVDVLGNDSYPPGSTVTAVTQGTLGEVTIAPDGSAVLYAPDPDANGADTFTYTLDDGAGSTDTATVQVDITPANDPPVADDDSLAVSRNAAATAVDVLDGDVDVDGDGLTITGATDGTKGTVVIDPDEKGLTYRPDHDAIGSDSFTYAISDGNGGSDTGTVSVTIDDSNVDPVAVTDEPTIAEDAAATDVPVLANDTDGDTDVLTITARTNGAKGAVVLTGPTTLTYMPNANAFGSDSFTYDIADGHGGTATGTVNVTITPSNDTPNAINDVSSSVPESAGPTVVAVLTNDIDIDGDTLSIIGSTNGAHGTVAITGGGTGLTYDPVQLYYGTDVFTYTVSDGHGRTDTATVLLIVVKDTVKPIAVAPLPSFRNHTNGASWIKVRQTWGGTDTGGTGIASYRLQVSVNGSSYSTISLSSATATTADRILSINGTYRYRVRATDRQGNLSGYAYGPTFQVIRRQDTSSLVSYAGTWKTTLNPQALGGSHRYTTAAGASVSYTGSMRDVAWVATKTTTSGSAQVWIDGSLAATVNLRATSTGYKKLVFHHHFDSVGIHTIEIRSLGGGRVYFDAFPVLR